MAKDYTIHIEPVLRPVLAPQERLLVASPLVKDPGTTEDVSVADELKNLLDPTILIGLGVHPGGLLQRATFGRAVAGGPESAGYALYAGVDVAGSPHLAVTDTRLIIFDVDLIEQAGQGWLRRWFGPAQQRARVRHDVSRAAIVGAIKAPAGLLRRGRFLVVFTDGSACALVCSPPSLGERAAEVLGPPRPAPGATGEEHS
ncbi:hypothetical protein AB0J86_38630 [Micromonospora sp. NPDC049559]|uniref:hypothetical protein n=1 Tax=Micromonospora sp. NPDC049559 TaxID=3155923 RepID=UPI003427CAB5